MTGPRAQLSQAPPLKIEEPDKASEVIDSTFLNTPQVVDASLSRRIGRDLAVKLETFNPIRSFKGRGTDFFMQGLTAGHETVCASAGNFGQAVAYAGLTREIPVTVFCAQNANPMKISRMRDWEPM